MSSSYRISCVDTYLCRFLQKLQKELPNATMRRVPNCGHMPHIEKPYAIAKLIADFVQGASSEDRPVSPVVDSVVCKN